MTKPLPKAVSRLRNAFLRCADELMRSVAGACPGFHLTRDHLDGRPPWCDACGRDRFGFLHDEQTTGAAPMTPEELKARYDGLQRVKFNIDAELVAIADRLRAEGQWAKVGRPRKPPTHTEAEAREANRRWQKGERTPWVMAGRRQYARERRRGTRAEEA